MEVSRIPRHLAPSLEVFLHLGRPVTYSGGVLKWQQEHEQEQEQELEQELEQSRNKMRSTPTFP